MDGCVRTWWQEHLENLLICLSCLGLQPATHMALGQGHPMLSAHI